MKVLCVDVGNTNTAFAIFKENKIIKKFNLSTGNLNFSRIKRKVGKTRVDDAIISSVVPGVNKILEGGLKALLNRQPYVLGKNLTVPIRNLYRRPNQVGQDRLVNAYAGLKLFAAPLIIVDFGTAITFDMVSKNKEYLGGLILPGLNISLEALAEKTALLPKINLKPPRELIGRDTQNSILSGIVYGFAALTDSLIQKIKNRVRRNTRVIATGGNIRFISGYCKQLDKIEPDLTLKGLNFIYRDTLKIGAKSAFRTALRVALLLILSYVTVISGSLAQGKTLKNPPDKEAPKATQQTNNQAFPSPSLLQMAWEAYNGKNYKDALKYIDRCIAIFDYRAKQQQASLNAPISSNEVNRYWALNDVATVKFIKGKICLDTNKTDEARAIFSDIIKNYSYATSYDPRGWYWSVAKASEQMLSVLNGTGVDIKDASSSYITSQAWEAFNRKDYKTAVKFADECFKLYKANAIIQQNSLANLPKGKEAHKYWALNDVGTCGYIAGVSALRMHDKEKAIAYFSFVTENLPFAQCWDNGGWFWNVADAARTKLRRLHALKRSE